METSHNLTRANVWCRVNLMHPPSGDSGSASAHTPPANCHTYTHISRWHDGKACKLGNATVRQITHVSGPSLYSHLLPLHTLPLSYILPFILHPSSSPSFVSTSYTPRCMKGTHSWLRRPPQTSGAPTVHCKRCCDALLNLATPHPLGSKQAPPPPLAAASHSLPLFFLG